MKKTLAIVLAGLLMSGIAMAGDGHAHGHGHAHGKYLNNVVHVDADGNKTALCGCGMEFTVNDETTSFDMNGMTIYACSEGCAMKMAHMDKEMKAGKMGELQMAVAQHDHMASNVMMADGKKMATCPCGMEFEVGEHAEYVVENGVKMYVCSAKCAEGFSASDKEMRAKAQMKARSTTSPMAK